MKGFVSEFGWTAFMLIAVVFIAFIGLIGSLYFQVENFISPDPSSVEFLATNNRPYILASVLAHTLMGDRQFLEQATEIVATGNDVKAGSGDLDVYLKDFFLVYGNDRFIGVAIKEIEPDENQLFYVDNLPKKCGEDLNGFCVEKKRRQLIDRYVLTVPAGCIDGRIETNAGANKCDDDELCCAEAERDSLPAGTITCGGYQPDDGDKDTKDLDLDDPGVCDTAGNKHCSIGRTEIQDVANECNIIDVGMPAVCCVPLKSETAVQRGAVTRAQIPLLYKNEKYGVVEVTAE